MDGDEILCKLCESKIIVYYHEQYNGDRGKCPICGVDFPLE